MVKRKRATCWVVCLKIQTPYTDTNVFCCRGIYIYKLYIYLYMFLRFCRAFIIFFLAF